ncbi:MAG: conjugative transposon protein TraM [Tannerellaceae bacterium]|jgi:hypothetical protein|nr:conjugative transposon protein TraM [Tannerellaceae bacterium]
MNTENRTNDNKPGLSGEQRQRVKKYAVFALMGIICAGSIYLIFAPSEDEKAKMEQTAGFNADIPQPKEEGIIGDKRDAYEQEQLRQKQAERMRSLSDFTAMLDGSETQAAQDDLVLLDSEPAKTKTAVTGSAKSRPTSSIEHSAQAYRDVNRTHMEYRATIMPIDLTVYDTDGQEGIFIPNLQELSAAKEIAANMGTSAGTSFNMNSDAGEQFVADMGRNLIQGVSQFTAKKLREVKVHLKAGYKVFLLPN